MLNKFKKSVGIPVGPGCSQTAFFMLNKFKKSVGIPVPGRARVFSNKWSLFYSAALLVKPPGPRYFPLAPFSAFALREPRH